MHHLFKHAPAMLIALELIEARTGRSKKNDVALRRRFAGTPNSIFQSFRVFDFGRPLNLRFDLRRRSANRVHALDSLAQ